MKPDRNFLLAHPAHFIALGFGSGLAPKAAGTFGTLVALPIYLLTYWLGGNALVGACAALLFGVGVWASGVTGKALGVSDHGGIVIDEIAAFLLVLAFVPAGESKLWWMVSAFVAFRLFDIVKPWPISVADRTIKGGFGVMFDDLLAALFSIALLLSVHTIMLGAPK